jgi:hypothetical protein
MTTLSAADYWRKRIADGPLNVTWTDGEVLGAIDRILATLDAAPGIDVEALPAVLRATFPTRYAASDSWTLDIEDAKRFLAEYARLTKSAPQPAAPETVACFECGGTGTVEGIDADPLPSGEPGEPYQVQEQCEACGGSGALPAAPETDLRWAAAELVEAHDEFIEHGGPVRLERQDAAWERLRAALGLAQPAAPEKEPEGQA